MSVNFLIYLLVGKLIIFFSMKFVGDIEVFGFVKKLLSCDLCWGFWVYSLLSFLLGEHLFVEIFYVPLLSEVTTGGLSSLLTHLITLGWKSKFEVIEIK